MQRHYMGVPGGRRYTMSEPYRILFRAEAGPGGKTASGKATRMQSFMGACSAAILYDRWEDMRGSVAGSVKYMICPWITPEIWPGLRIAGGWTAIMSVRIKRSEKYSNILVGGKFFEGGMQTRYTRRTRARSQEIESNIWEVCESRRNFLGLVESRSCRY